MVDLTTCFRKSFRLPFAATVLSFAGHLVKQTLSRNFRGERVSISNTCRTWKVLFYIGDAGPAFSSESVLFEEELDEDSSREALPRSTGQTAEVTTYLQIDILDHFRMEIASFIIFRFAFFTYLTNWKGDPWTLDISAFAPLSRTFRKIFVSNLNLTSKCKQKVPNFPETYRNQSDTLHSRTYAQPSGPYQSCSFIRVLQKKYVHIFAYPLSRLSRSILLSRTFANQHFPFAQALQINPLIKVNVEVYFVAQMTRSPMKKTHY